MEYLRKIAKNTLWQVIGKVLGTALGVITIGLITRYLGPTDFGYYTLALALIQFLATILDFGFYLIALREISAQPEAKAKIFNNVLTLRLISSIIFFSLGLGIIYLLNYQGVVKQTSAIFVLAFFLTSLVQLFTVLFQYHLKMGQAAIAETVGRLFSLLGVLFFINYQIKLPGFAWAATIQALIFLIILMILSRRFLKIKLAWDNVIIKSFLRKSWPVAVGIILNLIYFRADMIVLALFKSPSEVGLYGAPYRFLEILATFPHMFMGLVLPSLTAYYVTKNQAKFQNLSQQIFDFFLMLILPIFFGSLFLKEKIMVALAGHEFAPSGAVLPILILATAFIFLGTTFTYQVVIIEKQKTMLWFYGLAAALALLGYFLFIPQYSFMAAAWVTLVVEALVAISAYYLSKSVTGNQLNFINLSKIIFSGLIMSGLTYFIQDLNIYLIVTVAIVAYIIMLLLTKALDLRQMKIIWERSENLSEISDVNV